MIDERTEQLAALYVLDDLAGQERLDFEAQLARSPELRELVRQLSRALHAPAAAAGGPVRPDLLRGIHARLEADGLASDGRRPVALFRLPWAHIWAAAAAVMLVLNLFLLVLRGPADPHGRGVAAGQVSSDIDPSGPVVSSANPGSALLEARIRRLETDLHEQTARLEETAEARDALAAENAEFREFTAGWEREYTRLAARMLPFFQDTDRMSRFTVIEMVDTRSFETPGKSRGFAELANRFLTGEGNIAGAGSMEFVGPVVAAAPETLADKAATPSLNPASRAAAGAATYAGQGAVADQVTAGPAPGEPTGFTVWRDDEQKGFLDLYNLPHPETGAAFLWVRAGAYDPYVPVGFLPDMENGTGSLFYAVDEPNFTPAEILITAENPAAPGSQPTGSILLRGP